MSDRLLDVSNGTAAAIAGVTLSGAQAPAEGGAARVIDDATLSLTDVAVKASSGRCHGGGLLADGGAPGKSGDTAGGGKVPAAVRGAISARELRLDLLADLSGGLERGRVGSRGLRFSPPLAGRYSVVVTARGKTVARGSAVARAGAHLVRIKLRRTAAGRRLLARGHRRVRLAVRFAPPGQPPISVGRTATL